MGAISEKPLPLGFWIPAALTLAAIMTISILDSAKPGAVMASDAQSSATLTDAGALPDLGGAVAWLNSSPLSHKSLHGKVVLVNFWTYSCINSLRELPYTKSWAAK